MSKSEVTRDRFPALFRLKDEIKRRFDVSVEAKPFDQYQGPYLLVGGNIKIWMQTPDGQWNTGSLNNQWHFEGIEIDDIAHGGSTVYSYLEEEGYERKNKSQEPTERVEEIVGHYESGSIDEETAFLDITEALDKAKQPNHLTIQTTDFRISFLDPDLDGDSRVGENGEFITWTVDEVRDDPNVLGSISNAVKLAYNNPKKLKERVGY